MKLKLRRFMAYLLVAMMLISVVPASALAEIAAAGSTAASQPSASLLSVIKPDENKYHTYIFYDVNGNEIAGSRQILKDGETLRLPSVQAIDGKKFVGWMDENGVQLAIDAGAVTVEENATIKCYAKYTEIYYVFFMDGTGENARVIETKTGVSGDVIAFDDVNFGVATDESITGWYLDALLTQKVTSVTIGSANVTLYPKVEKGYWITFESNGGTYIAPEFVVNGAVATAPQNPEKAGYTFGGWYLDADLTQTASFASISSEATVYAKWTANTRTNYTVIHFWENADDDGYSFHESETKTGTTGATTNARAKTYQGFTAQTITQETINGDGSTIVKVYYKRNLYSVKFYTNSNRNSSSKEYTSLRITAKYGANISDKWPTYDGSSTWATSNNGDTYQVNIDTMPLNGDEFYGPKTGRGSETAYYYIEVLPGEKGDTTKGGRTYKLHHKDVSPGTGYSVTDEDKYPITGFTYAEGTKNGGRYDNAKFYYTRNSYAIKFISNAATVKSESVKYQQSIADKGFTPDNNLGAGKEDYVFAGWYDNELGEGNPFDFADKTMPAQNITLYAKWVAPTYTVTVYDADRETVLDVIEEVKKGSTISESDMPVSEVSRAVGDVFLGWVDEDGKPFNFETKITRDYNLYAKLGNTNAFAVTYDGNGATGGATSDSAKYAKNAIADVKANGFTREGMLFLYWQTEDGDKYYPNDEIKMTGDVTLYAVWGEMGETVSLYYHSNFDVDQVFIVSELTNNDTVTVKSYAETKLPEQEGHTFIGWNTWGSGDGTAFAAGDQARLEGDDNHLYAQWRVNEYDYSVEYYIDGVKDESLTETARARYGATIKTYTDKCPTGYALEKVENLPLKIGTDGNVISVYYKKSVFNLTVHYVYAEGGTAADDHTESVSFGADYSVNSPAIDGYTADKLIVSGTMPANNVEETVVYSKRTDLSYRVIYRLNGTEISIADDKVMQNQTFGAEVTETPADISGFTPVSNDAQKLTLTTGENVIVFYYYANATLTANSDSVTYDAAEHSVSGFQISANGEFTETYKPDFSAIAVQASGIDAGTYPAEFAAGTVGTVDQTGKYIVVEAINGALKITEKPIEITAGSASKQYDGEPLTENSYTNTELATGDSIESVTITGTITLVGTAVNVASEAVIKNADGKNVTANYAITYVPGTLEITKSEKTLKVVANSASWVYDGQEHSDGGYTVTYGTETYVVKAGESATLSTGDKVTAVIGKTVKNVSDTATGNNKITSLLVENKKQYASISFENGTLAITPIAIELTADSDSKVYDGTALEKNSFTITEGAFVQGEGIESAKIVGSQLNAGSSDNVIAEYALNEKTLPENYSIEVKKGTLTVTPVTDKVTVTITENNGVFTYDAAEHTVTSYSSIVSTNALYDVATSVKITEDQAHWAATATDVGEYPLGILSTDFENVNANFTNVEFVIVDGTLTINPMEVELTAESASRKYDGTALTQPEFTATALATGDAHVFTVAMTDASTITNVGTADNVIATVDGVAVEAGIQKQVGNYLITTANGKLEITPRQVILTSASDSKVFDGSPLENHTVTVTGDGFATGEGATYNVTGSQQNVGSSENAFDFTLNEGTLAENYKIEMAYGTLTVTPVDTMVVVTIAGNTKTETYDGTEKSVEGYQVISISDPLYTANDFAYAGAGATATGTEVGSYAMGLEEKDFSNKNGNFKSVTFVVTDGWLKIEPAQLTITAKDLTVEYDGKAHGENGYEATATVKDQTIESVVIDGSRTNAGTYEDEFVPHDAKIVDAEGKDVTANYAITYVPGTLIITKRGAGDAKVKVIANDNTVTYDGNAHGENGFTTERLAEGHRVETVTIDGSKTQTGVYEDLLAPQDAKIVDAEGKDVTANYVITYEEGTLTIKPVAEKVVVTIKGNEGSELYDGTEKVVEGYQVISISNPLYTTDDFEFTGSAVVKGKNADVYPMGLTAENFNNVSKNFESVEFIVEDGKLEITPRQVVLTSASDSKVFDGSPLENHTVTVTGDGFATGEGATYNVTGSQQNVGSSENAFDFTLNEGTLAENYKIEMAYGTLTVTPITEKVIVTIRGHETTAEYDGTKYVASGFDAVSSNTLYTEDCYEFSGNAHLESIHSGEFWMNLKASDFKNTSINFTNVEFVIEKDGYLAIAPRMLIITAGSYEGDYDAKWHEVGYTAEGLADTDTITALQMKDNRILKPGTLTASFLTETLKITHENGTDSTGDYRVEYAPGTLTVNTVIVKYRVQYYYDGVLFGGSTEEGVGEVLTKITEYIDKPRDMMFDHVDNFPLTLGLDEEENVIRVYYVHIPLTGYLGAHNVGDCIE